MTKYDYKDPLQKNQHIMRSDKDLQKIINQHPTWTKKDFRGEGKNNKKRLLTRKETERPGLKFGHHGNKIHISEVYKHSTSESIERFEQGEITEQNFRNNSKSKKKRDEMPLYLKKRNNIERNENLSEDQLTEKRRRDREYYEKIKDK